MLPASRRSKSDEPLLSTSSWPQCWRTSLPQRGDGTVRSGVRQLRMAFAALGHWNDSLNLFLATRQLVKRRRRGRGDVIEEMLRDALTSRPEPQAVWFYLDTARVGWRAMLFYSLLFMGVATYVGEKIAGYAGSRIGLGIGALPAAASLVGEFDLLWRLVVLRSARRRFRAAGGAVDEPTRRLLRIARVNDGTLLLQIVVGLATALPLALVR